MDKKLKKKRIQLYAANKTNLSFKDTSRLEEKGWKEILQKNRMKQKVVVATLTSNKSRIQLKTTTRYKLNHYIMTKSPIHHSNITIINTYAPTLEHLNI